ncbi:MAG: LysR family transcriptional regulator, partial [Acidimicrobiales bacterium]
MPIRSSPMPMELRDLRVFLAVVECRGFTAAGRKLYMVQSGVSDAVARLERELGLSLLDRRRGGTRPTPGGETLQRWARLLLNSSERAEREVRSFRTLEASSLRVGLLPTITALVLPGLLERLRASHPRMSVRVHEGLAPDLVELVRVAELDLAVVFFPLERVPDVELVDVAARPLHVLVSASHGLHDAGSVPLSDLAEEGWVTYPPHNPGRLWLEHACRLASFVPRIAVEVETPTQLQIFVEAGSGVAMVPLI